jgi:hypothetical protein
MGGLQKDWTIGALYCIGNNFNTKVAENKVFLPTTQELTPQLIAKNKNENKTPHYSSQI